MVNKMEEIIEKINGYKISCSDCGLEWYSEIKIQYCPECKSKNLFYKSVRMALIGDDLNDC